MIARYLKFIIVFVFLALVAVQASKPYVLDEIDFPLVSEATSITGKPIYYRGEQSPVHVGTYHPTLYINSLAVFMKFFGSSESSVRSFGASCAVISVYLLVMILRCLRKADEPLEAALVGLFLLNPYTIANATLPDIDSTILPVVMLFFIYVALHKMYKRSGVSNSTVYGLSLIFGLALWSKLTTPLVLPVFLLGLSYIVSKNKKKSLLLAAKVSLFGTLAFLSTYFVYCKSLGLSGTYTYRFLIASFTKGTSSEVALTGAIHNLGNAGGFLFWPTLPVVVLFGISLIGVMFDRSTSEATRIKKLLASLGFFVSLFYVALISPFGGFFKYPFATFGLCVLTVVFFYDSYSRNIKALRVWGPVVFVLGFLVEHINWRDEMFAGGTPFRHVVQLLLIVVGIYATLRLLQKQSITPSLVTAGILFSIGFQLSVSRVQAVSDYPTKYHYGQSGLEQTAQYLKSRIEPGEVVWAMKDVGYYSGNKYEESYGYYFDATLQSKLVTMLAEGKIRYYVATTGIGQDNIDYYKDVKLILEEGAIREKQIGNFIIFKAKEE